MGVHNHWKGSGPAHCKECAKELRRMAKAVADSGVLNMPTTVNPTPPDSPQSSTQDTYSTFIDALKSRGAITPQTPPPATTPAEPKKENAFRTRMTAVMHKFSFVKTKKFRNTLIAGTAAAAAGAAASTVIISTIPAAVFVVPAFLTGGAVGYIYSSLPKPLVKTWRPDYDLQDPKYTGTDMRNGYMD